MISLLDEIESDKTGLLPALISDYIAGKESIAHLYKYPFEFSSFKQVIQDKQKDNTDRKLLVDVLKEQYSSIPTSELVTKNIESLSSGKTFTVTTAHQPNLFLGPLYCIYKIACVINVTNQLKKSLPDYNFVPVFWMGSEDHDIEELNHTFVNGKKIEWKDAGGGAIGRLKTESLKSVVEELKTISNNTEVISILEKGLSKYKTFGKFTQYFVNEIFKEYGLVVIDQDDARLKKRFVEVIKDEVLNSRAANVLKPALDFIEANYKLQAKPREINFFYLGEGFRERIIYNTTSKKFEINNTSTSFTKDEMVSEIENHPERFSPNVICRPLYQEVILPNLAFIGGSAELSYWLELKPLFEYYKVNYPIQIPRNSAALINSSTQKKLEKLNLSVKDFFCDVEKLISHFIKERIAPEVYLNEEKRKIEELFNSISAKAEAADVTLKQSVAAEKQKALSAIDNLEAKILKAEKKRQETSVNQIRAIHALLFPENTLQERRENFIPYYDNKFITYLVEHLNPFYKNLKIFLQD